MAEYHYGKLFIYIVFVPIFCNTQCDRFLIKTVLKAIRLSTIIHKNCDNYQLNENSNIVSDISGTFYVAR